MSKTKLFTLPLLVFMLLFSSLGTALAEPPRLPSSFYGEIRFIAGDGVPGVGDDVDVYVAGVSGAVISVDITQDDGKLVYSVNLPADDPDTPAKDGGVEEDIVTFKIGGRLVAESVWHEGTNARLDFHPPKAIPGGP